MKLRWLVLGILVAVLLAPALTLTGDRILTPGGGVWVQLVSFTPYAVLLYGLALLLLVIAWVLVSGGWRKTVGVLALVAVAGLGLHLFWASGPYVGQAGTAAGTGRPFTLMTANLMLGEASPSEVVATAVRNDVDVLVLVEVTPQELGNMATAGLNQAFPYSEGQADHGPSGTMVLSDRKLTDVQRLGTRFGGYSMTVGPSGDSFTLLAVHPQHPKDDATGWAADHRVILDAVSALHDVPAVIAGDFNATLDHKPMRELEGKGFDDAASQANSGWQPTWPASGEVSILSVPIPSVLQIDHVMVNRGVRARKTESVTIAGTDHRAVVARLEL